ncbi:MAG: hydrazine dehydrogenase, partial [Planctomycetota bacterium]
KTIFDLCPEPGWLDTHHAPAAEVEYINRMLKEVGMSAGHHSAHEQHSGDHDPGSRSMKKH